MCLARPPWPRIAIATIVALSAFCAGLEAESSDPIGAAATADACLNARASAIRARDIVVGQLIDEGAARSATFAAVACELSGSDVVAFIDSPSELPPAVDAYLVFISSTPAKRYVMIRLSHHLGYPRNISLIGHELHHALEIARHPEVVDNESLTMMYQRFGRAASQPSSWDSDEAVLVGRMVARELASANVVGDER